MAEGRVTATSLNLRDAPEGAVIGSLGRGDRVTILDQQDGWMSVSATVGGATKLGWASAQFIDAVPAAPPADDGSASVTVAAGKAIGPDGRAFASVQGKGFFTLGQTTLEAWLAASPPGLSLAPSLIRVVQAVSRNEGRLEAVNSYDNCFLSFGLFQWTSGAKDQPGELAGLLALIRRSDPQAFDDCFGRYGLGVALQNDGKTGFLTLAGAALKTAQDKEALRSADWAYRFWKAGQNDGVRAAELDFAAARVPGFLRLPVAGRAVRDWLSSEYGVALLLDEHVNRPGHVPGTLKNAIDGLPPGTDPARWGDAEEADLILRYIAAREATNMTDPAKRATSIGDCVRAGTLSDKRGSFAPAAAAPSV
jgi:hypothetical protein